MGWPTNIKPPLYIRTSSRVRYMGKDYIVKRDVRGAIYGLVGRMSRKLPSMEEAVVAAKNKKLICQWGGYYAIFTRIDPEEQPMILQYLWAEERKRGIEPPKIDDSVSLSDEG